MSSGGVGPHTGAITNGRAARGRRADDVPAMPDRLPSARRSLSPGARQERRPLRRVRERLGNGGQDGRRASRRGTRGRGNGGQRLPVVPRHPVCRVGRQLLGVSLQLGQIIERIGPAEFARVNEAHVQVPDLGPFLGQVEQRVLAVENDLLQRSFTDVVVQGSPGLTQKERQLGPVPEQVGDGRAQPGVGLHQAGRRSAAGARRGDRPSPDHSGPGGTAGVLPATAVSCRATASFL